jgi:hypothetical protein
LRKQVFRLIFDVRFNHHKNRLRIFKFFLYLQPAEISCFFLQRAAKFNGKIYAHLNMERRGAIDLRASPLAAHQKR